ncbi:MAG: T9SS type A sorting domain-containing protein [Paludibacteraceae bacterium]|nr:T9SS type A sorting domain-containing protein [Paludibacteraceae bacterium]
MGKRLLTIGLLFAATVCQVSAAYTCKKWFDKTGKTCNDYAIILIGGTEEPFMHEAAKAYQYLINVKGCNKNKVRIYGQDGLGCDFDGDGKNDKWASSADIYRDQAFDFLKNNSTISNDIFITVIDHGDPDVITLWKSSLTAKYLSEKLSKIKFKKATIALSACYSGSFIDDIKRKNVTIITSAPADRYGWFSTYGDLFMHEFYKALGKGYKGEATVDADYNRDGVISYEEAFVYAKDHDTNTKPSNASESWYTIPRYWSSDTPWRFCRDTDWGVVTQGYLNGTVTKEAMYLLIGNGTIAKGSNVTFNSGKTIRLTKGFKVVQGAKFRTSHFDCEAEKRANEAELRKFEIVDQEVERENGAADITVSPNPSTGRFIVTLGEVEADVTVLDMQGRVIRQFANASGDFELDITDFPNGVYVLALNSANFKLTQKIVKY